MPRSSFPRRQQYRRLRRGAARYAAALLACTLAMIAAGAGEWTVGGALLLVGARLLVDARVWVRLAARSRTGARSEDEVRHALAALEAEGWRVCHSLPYDGRGDIDSIAIAPTAIGFAIEVKTRSFDRRHLAAVRAMAHWLYRRRRRWCRRGALPVLCVVRARAVERIVDGVLVVSLERLVWALRTAPGRRRVPRSSRPTPRTADRPRRHTSVASQADWHGVGLGHRDDRPGRAMWSAGLVLAALVGEDADGQEVREAVGDRLGDGGRVAVKRADRERREPAGLLGVLDQRRRLARR